jgi:hypothetical protein
MLFTSHQGRTAMEEECFAQEERSSRVGENVKPISNDGKA